jgi:hypothetical protein
LVHILHVNILYLKNMTRKTKIIGKEIESKIISIIEDKDNTLLNILVNKAEKNLELRNEKYNLGEIIKMTVHMKNIISNSNKMN